MNATQSTLVSHGHPAATAREDDAYVGRRALNAEVAAALAPSVHGDLKVLRGLAAKQNAVRRMGKNRRTHGRGQGW